MLSQKTRLIDFPLFQTENHAYQAKESEERKGKRGGGVGRGHHPRGGGGPCGLGGGIPQDLDDKEVPQNDLQAGLAGQSRFQMFRQRHEYVLEYRGQILER